MSLGKLVVLGGAGFIGSRFLELFRDHFDSVWVVDRISGPSHPDWGALHRHEAGLRPGRDHILCLDAGDRVQHGRLFADADAVAILNADTGTARSQHSPAACVADNALVLAQIVEGLSAHADPARTRILFTSSRAVYGEGDWRCSEHGKFPIERSAAALDAGRFEPLCPLCARPLDLLPSREDLPLQPLSVYGMTKQFGEQLLGTLATTRGFDIRIVRYQNVYGQGQEISNPYTGVLNWFSQSLLKDEQVPVFEQGHIVRDFIHVDDAARLLWLALDRRAVENGRVQILNGGSGVPVKLQHVAELLKAAYGSASVILPVGQFRPGDVLGAVADMHRAEAMLGFHAAVPLAQGLAAYAAWFRATLAARHG
jgi:dTDP-L-rhamnose 4-epimerase